MQLSITMNSELTLMKMEINILKNKVKTLETLIQNILKIKKDEPYMVVNSDTSVHVDDDTDSEVEDNYSYNPVATYDFAHASIAKPSETELQKIRRLMDEISDDELEEL